MGYDPNTPYNQGQPQQPPYGQPAIPNTSPVYGQGQPPYQGPTQAYGGAVGFNILGNVAGPTVTANAYYQAIKNQDYNKAYSYWDTSKLTAVNGQQVTEQAFAALAQLDDTRQGPVTNFSQTNISVNNDTATVTMSVTRNGPPYTVQLQMSKVGNDWKITRADNI